MKTSSLSMGLGLCGLIAFCSQPIHAESTGINFAAQPILGGDPPLAPLDTAGFIPQQFWNNAFGASGSIGPEGDGGGGFSVFHSGFSAQWAATGNGLLPIGGPSLNVKLMQGDLAGAPGSSISVTLSGIPVNYTRAPFALLVYCDADNSGQSRTFKVSVTAGPQAITQYGRDTGLSYFEGEFTRVPENSVNDLGEATPIGDLFVIRDLTADSLTLTVTTTGSGGPALNAIQLVAAADVPVYTKDSTPTSVLELPIAESSYATDINNAGDVVGSIESANGARAFIYSSGVVSNLEVGAQSWGSAINDSGAIVGTTLSAAGKKTAFIKDAAGVRLIADSMSESGGAAVNEAGDVAGYAVIGAQYHPFAWVRNQLRVLSVPTGLASGIAYGINDSGVVVGIAQSAAIYPYHAVVWEPLADGTYGEAIDLGYPGLYGGTPAPGDPANNSIALGINRAGDVTGMAAVANNYYNAFLAGPGGMLALGVPAGHAVSGGNAINNFQEVVGEANTAISGGGGVRHAALWTAQLGFVDLNVKFAPPTGLLLSTAAAINDRGQIVGTALRDGLKRAFLVNPPQLRTLTPAKITSPLAGKRLATGAAHTLFVTVEGTAPLAFKWELNGTLIAGATNASLAFDSIQKSNAGEYKVTVSNAYGTDWSSATISVVNPPELDIAMYAGITVTGEIGAAYRVEYREAVDPANAWTFLKNVTLSASSEFVVDMDSPNKPKRFYRAQLIE